MKLHYEPTVHLVGKPGVHGLELMLFLEDHEVENWESDAIHDADLIPEVAGRLCYMSFGKPRPGGNKTYLSHILESGHGCYDIETEVLTAEGWKFWGDVCERTEFCTLNPQTKEIEYQKPNKLIAYEHSGLMYRVESQQVDLLVTPNHRMYVCPTTTLLGRRREKYSFFTAAELGTRSHAYSKSGGIWKPKGDPLHCDDPNHEEIFCLLGFTIGDGTVDPSGGRVRFHLRRERKISWLRRICSSMDLEVKERGDHYSVSIPGMYRDLFSKVYNEDREKIIPRGVLTACNKNQLLALYDGLIQSDGSESDTCICFDSTSQELINQFQQLCLHIGLAANVGYTDYEREGCYGTKPLTRSFVVRRSLNPEVNRFRDSEGTSYWVKDWTGVVFCAEVPNGTLYVRRNGKPVWCGNSVLEHVNFNFIFCGISRSLSHELVRHRAGWAYSQLSQRYVDESVAEYVVPYEVRREVKLAMAEIGQWSALESQDKAAEEILSIIEPLIAEKLNNTAEEILIGLEWLRSCEQDTQRYKRFSDYLLNKIILEKWHDSFFGSDCTIPKDEARQHMWSAEPMESRTTMRKAARSAARSVLPNATETKVFATANVRALRHFIEMRGSRFADHEIRMLAYKVWQQVSKFSENLFSDYEWKLDGDFPLDVTTPYRKV